MSLIEARDAIVTALTPKLGEMRTVEPHGGRFTGKELALLLGKAPCTLVACLGIQGYALAGRERRDCNLRWVAYCLANDKDGQPRDVLAMETAYRIVELLPGQHWGLEERNCKPPELDSIRAENLYTGDIDRKRIALWAVTWSQRFIFPETEEG